jgi:hypothetical protein
MSSGNDYLKEFFLQERRKGSLSLMVMERESGPVRQPASASTSPAGCRPAVFGSLRLPSGQARLQGNAGLDRFFWAWLRGCTCLVN